MVEARLDDLERRVQIAENGIVAIDAADGNSKVRTDIRGMIDKLNELEKAAIMLRGNTEQHVGNINQQIQELRREGESRKSTARKSEW